MRGLIYNTLIHLALPVIAALSWRKCHRAQQQQSQLKNCFTQKFGAVAPNSPTHGILIHAVSLGETRSILPLITQLQQEYPNTPITLTNGSVRGATQLVEQLPKGIHHSFLPLDYPFAIRRFLAQLQPKLVIVVETEIWPNLINGCQQMQIPIALVNARLKHSSMKSYQKYGGHWLTQRLNQCTLIACQFDSDREHFLEMGVDASHLQVTGNLKFDLNIPTDLSKQVPLWQSQHSLNSRFIWVAASTHEDEEALMLEAHQQLINQLPNALLILVPRQAERFDEVAQICLDSGLISQRRSELSNTTTISNNTQVLLADSVGEMLLWMALCNIAFIGGSMVNFGGHNILEPAAFAKPVLSGPHYQNLAALYQVFLDANALTLVETPAQLAQTLIKFQQDSQLYQQYSQRALDTFQSQSGSLDRLMQQLKPLLNA